MLQLVYMSIASDDLLPADMDGLFAASRQHNLVNEITGVLVRKGKAFLHVLEGPKAAVEDTFIRIIADPRHHSVLIVSRKMLTRREFGEFAMADCQLPDLQDRVFAELDPVVSTAPRQVQERFRRLVES